MGKKKINVWKYLNLKKKKKDSTVVDSYFVKRC